jgi:hypothetical protein
VRAAGEPAHRVGLCCLLVYNANGRAISAGDTYPALYLPFAIWRYHTVLLDPIAQERNFSGFYSRQSEIRLFA